MDDCQHENLRPDSKDDHCRDCGAIRFRFADGHVSKRWALARPLPDDEAQALQLARRQRSLVRRGAP